MKSNTKNCTRSSQFNFPRNGNTQKMYTNPRCKSFAAICDHSLLDPRSARNQDNLKTLFMFGERNLIDFGYRITFNSGAAFYQKFDLRIIYTKDFFLISFSSSILFFSPNFLLSNFLLTNIYFKLEKTRFVSSSTPRSLKFSDRDGKF